MARPSKQTVDYFPWNGIKIDEKIPLGFSDFPLPPKYILYKRRRRRGKRVLLYIKLDKKTGNDIY